MVLCMYYIIGKLLYFFILELNWFNFVTKTIPTISFFKNEGLKKYLNKNEEQFMSFRWSSIKFVYKCIDILFQDTICVYAIVEMFNYLHKMTNLKLSRKNHLKIILSFFVIQNKLFFEKKNSCTFVFIKCNQFDINSVMNSRRVLGASKISEKNFIKQWPNL